jgi:hypothetical protein
VRLRDGRALLTALPLAFVIYLALAPDGDARLVAPGLFRVVLGVDLAIRAALAVWGLRAYLSTGESTPLILGVGLLAFVAVSVWRALLAVAEPPYVYSVYGSLARAVFAVALLSVAAPPLTIATAHRRRLLVSGLAIAAALCLAGWALSVPIERLAGGQPAEVRRLTHLIYEGTTLLLTATAAARLVRAPHQFGPRVRGALLVGLILTAEQSLFLLTGEPWQARWWLGRLTGLAAAVVFGWAVVRSGVAARTRFASLSSG